MDRNEEIKLTLETALNALCKGGSMDETETYAADKIRETLNKYFSPEK